MKVIIKQALHQIEGDFSIQQMKRVQGGEINESFYVETKRRDYFIKCHAKAPHRFFELEARGLELIQATNTISIPKVLDYQDVPGRSYLIMEWIEGEKTLDTDIQLGQQIAAMHKTLGEQHGFMYDTFVGLLHQPNGLFTDWFDYFRDQRLFTQFQYAIENKLVSNKRRKQMELLLDKLAEWIPKKTPASYLHGDLWGGNWLVGRGGVPYIVDPSFLFGDRHFELAFTELFKGFSSSFYDAYKSDYPLSTNYNNMKPIYQLYYLFVHLNIFGEMYGSRIDAILDRYIGR